MMRGKAITFGDNIDTDQILGAQHLTRPSIEDMAPSTFENYAYFSREATIDDLPSILALYAQPAIDDGLCLELDRATRIFRTMQRYPCYKIFLAEQDNQVVGTFALLIMDNLGHLGKPSGLVVDVAVWPSFHRQGVGRAMMHFAMAKCREFGRYKMALSSNIVRTEAHAFYESLGFIRHGYSFQVQL